MRYREYLHTYDIVYDMFSCSDTILYVIHTISYADIQYRINIRYRTSNIVCSWMLYRIYDIVYTIWYTTSNTRPTISFIRTYDIVGDQRYSMWQESRWLAPFVIARTLSHLTFGNLYSRTFFFAPPSESDSDAIGGTGAQSLELEALNSGDGADSSSLLISETQMKNRTVHKIDKHSRRNTNTNFVH